MGGYGLGAPVQFMSLSGVPGRVSERRFVVGNAVVEVGLNLTCTSRSGLSFCLGFWGLTCHNWALRACKWSYRGYSPNKQDKVNLSRPHVQIVR